MINKRLLLFCGMLAGAGLLCWAVCSCWTNANKFESDEGVVIDGSTLRFFNKELIVTNSLSFRVKPTPKTSEWIYVFESGSVVEIDGHRLMINEKSISHICTNEEEGVYSAIKSELPVLLRFFKDEVVVAGSGTWANGQIKIEYHGSVHDVKVIAKKTCKIVIKANWYEFTG